MGSARMPKDHQSSFFPFPQFLLPPTVFRRGAQRTGNRPAGSNAKYLEGHVSYLRCSRCAAHLCMTSQIISKGFTGRHGRAYLVSSEPIASAVSVDGSSSRSPSLPNTSLKKPVPRQLVTGAHTVSDIVCTCGSELGWKYVTAEEESQRYKVGKCILETNRISTTACWEPTPGMDLTTASLGRAPPERTELQALEDSIEFDSQDEDECEDLFAGIWSPGLAARRRSRKIINQGMFGFA